MPRKNSKRAKTARELPLMERNIPLVAQLTQPSVAYATKGCMSCVICGYRSLGSLRSFCGQPTPQGLPILSPDRHRVVAQVPGSCNDVGALWRA
jgi:hypothetical protein